MIIFFFKIIYFMSLMAILDSLFYNTIVEIQAQHWPDPLHNRETDRFGLIGEAESM